MKNAFTLTEKILLALYQGTDERALTYRPFTYLTRIFAQVNPGSLRVLSAHLIENGSLDKIEREGRVLLGITEMGKKELVGRPKTMQKWNGEIYMVILSVPEEKREIRHKIRTMLTNYNNSMLQPGIWFSPVKNEELTDQVRKNGFSPYVIFAQAHNVTGPVSIPQLVITAWELDKLQKSYEKYLDEAGQMQKMTHFDTARYSNLIDLQELLLVTTRNDPFFSDEFMPLSLLRKKAWNTFQILLHKKML